QLQILPLIDGLDQLSLNKQIKCVQQINQLLNGDVSPLHLVICASIINYKKLPEPLDLNGAIFLRPLTIPQIQDYLINSRSRELWQNIETDQPLLKLAKIPLYLTMMTLAYEEILIMSWKHLNSFEDQRDYLFNAYIRRQLNQDIHKSQYLPGKAPKSESFRRWLGWLATRLTTDEVTEFSVKKIPIHWLDENEQKPRYKLGLKLILGLIWVIVIGIMIAGIITKINLLLITGIGLGLLWAILLEKSSLKKNIEQFVIRWILCKDGNIPWNYQRFLNDATDKLLLQKTDDRYRFINRLLRDHFVNKI
ncbi:MAG: NACHT domain-containing protein, partial [Planktothrix sp.]